MYTIGELSKLVQISVDALRHYDEIGLLKPHSVDPVSRYRYYSAEQMNEIVAIMQWKRLGFGLEAIKEILTCMDKVRVEEICRSQMEKLIAEREQLDKSIALLQGQVHGWEEGAAMKPRTVLIVDDAAFIREIVADILAKHGLNVIGTAADGESGIRLYTEFKPDLVILDIGLPDLDGFEVARQMKKIDPRPHLLMCSARGTITNALCSLREGIHQFVVKPFMPDVLLRAVIDFENRQINKELVLKVLADDRIGLFDECFAQDKMDRFINLFAPPGEWNNVSDDDLWNEVARLVKE